MVHERAVCGGAAGAAVEPSAAVCGVRSELHGALPCLSLVCRREEPAAGRLAALSLTCRAFHSAADHCILSTGRACTVWSCHVGKEEEPLRAHEKVIVVLSSRKGQ